MTTHIKLFIPVICYNHTCHTAFMFSLMKLVMVLKDYNIVASLYQIGFDSLISRARNAAVAYFMSNDYTHLLFLDADIEFSVEDILKLINANEKIIGGAYAQKWLNTEKVREVFKNEPIPENPMSLCTNYSFNVPYDKITQEKVEVPYLTTGCMLINKSVIDKLMRAYPERQYINNIDGYMSANKSMFYNFFSAEINTDTMQYESEDYCFCRLWTALSEKVYVMPDISLTHHGWYGYEINMKKQLEYFTKSV